MRRVTSLVAVLLSSAAFDAEATTVRAMDEPEMVSAAAAIVRGVVAEVLVRRDARGVIVTDVVIRTAEIYKSEVSVPELTITQMGGTLDGVTLHLPGNNRYAVGEEVLLFLERNDAGLVEMGVGAGKYRVLRDAAGVWVERELGDLSFARVLGRGTVPVPPPPLTREPLAAFAARISRWVRP